MKYCAKCVRSVKGDGLADEQLEKTKNENRNTIQFVLGILPGIASITIGIVAAIIQYNNRKTQHIPLTCAFAQIKLT